MKKSFFVVALLVYGALMFGGCSTQFYQSSNNNLSQTQVVLSQDNFRTVGEVEGISVATRILGIGGLSKKSVRANAVAEMFKNAKLSGSQTIVNINVKQAQVGFPPFYWRTVYTATGTVIEFVNETDKEALAKAKVAEQARLAAEREALAKAKAEEQTRLIAEQEALAKAKAEEHARLAAEQEALAKAKAEEQARLVAEKEAAEKAKAAEKEAAEKAKIAKKEARAKAKAEWPARLAEKDIERCINSNIFNLQHLRVDDFTTSYTDLGNQYFYGKGKEFSIEKAFLCYNYGAKRGEAEAFLLIAQYYETGRAHGAFRIEQDSNIALLFYEKAAALQVQGASEGVKRVQSSK